MLDSLIRRTSWVNRAMPRVLFMGSYPPRECGIATFTEDVRSAYDLSASRPSTVLAVTDEGRSYRYGPEVIGEILRDDWRSYDDATTLVNRSDAEVVNIQHEYGLFGGEWGDYLVEFLSGLRKPTVTTLHTVLPDPDARLRATTRELCNRSDTIVVMSLAGRERLRADYAIDGRKIRVVPHGAPSVPHRSTHRYKRKFGLADKTVISTFGLIGRGKGIEYIIDALPTIFASAPDAVYVLCGETHPHVRRWEGEAYRESLRLRSEALGISERVHFANHYMSDDEVVDRLLGADVYVSPSIDPNQVVSGTLSYAVACGRPVIATANSYARELLAEGRGVTVPCRDVESLAAACVEVLKNGRLRRSLARAAYEYGRRMMWPAVARGYESAFVDALVGSRRTAYRAGAALHGAGALAEIR
jgi:glycosyltransferase involved in cell wall biosynthesis